MRGNTARLTVKVTKELISCSLRAVFLSLLHL